MSLEIIPINGTSHLFDYDLFKEDVKNFIGKNCSDAKIFLFNNFPVSVSAETNIDLILIIVIEDKPNNYYIPKLNGNKPVYFHNQIIPIKFVTQFQNDTISVDDNNQLIANEAYIDYSSDINSMRASLTNYLSEKCGFRKKELYVRPLIFIQGKGNIIMDSYLVYELFEFKIIHSYFSQNSSDIFIAYKDWKTVLGYKNLPSNIEQITDQASKDSIVGFLTKKKIERIGKQLSSSKPIYEELNTNLVIINGKAGAGKSSELLLLAMKCINNGNNILFLTYNKLLIFDIAKTIKSYNNDKLDAVSGFRPGDVSILTLHAFFYRLSMSLGVLHVLSASRIEKLLIILKNRMRQIYDVIVNVVSRRPNCELALLKVNIQNHTLFDVGTKEVGIDFINFLIKKGLKPLENLKKHSIDFYNNQKLKLCNIEASNIFISDYYGVLEKTLFQINNPKEYYRTFDIENKHELLDSIKGLSKKYEEEKDGKKIITEKGFFEFNNRRVGGRRGKGKTLFIDEAQDCHRFEKEIIISIFGSNNIIVANGGKEQLIRHVELCNWEVSDAKKINVKKYAARNKSYRVKKTTVDFCNYVAKKFQIDFNLEPLESEDEGELLFDFRQTHNETEMIEIFNYLSLKGEVNGCTPYERLLVLKESSSQANGLSSQYKSAIINEYNNIEDALNFQRSTWKHKESLEKNNFLFWDSDTIHKSQPLGPNSNESRIIHYESCRGLEAWSVICFAFDKFFDQKRKDPDAEKYLIGDLFLQQNNEQRKSMYAATWALMALTRVIDTMYIQINDRDSIFGRVVVEYLNQKNKNVREF